MSIRTWLLWAGGKHLQKELALLPPRCSGTSPLDTTPISHPKWYPAGPANPGILPSVQLALLFDDLSTAKAPGLFGIWSHTMFVPREANWRCLLFLSCFPPLDGPSWLIFPFDKFASVQWEELLILSHQNEEAGEPNL